MLATGSPLAIGPYLHLTLCWSAHRGGQQDSRVAAVVCRSPFNHLGQCRKGSILSFTVAFQILRTGLFEVPNKVSWFINISYLLSVLSSYFYFPNCFPKNKIPAIFWNRSHLFKPFTQAVFPNSRAITSQMIWEVANRHSAPINIMILSIIWQKLALSVDFWYLTACVMNLCVH